MQTPPSTTLSTPSPTERQDPLLESTMLGFHRPIYLLVATATKPPLGIGLKGNLPWGQISSDMAFFRKVTSGTSTKNLSTELHRLPNKVIMGRKTWDSIPVKFRPLAGRTNVIITRNNADGVAESILAELKAKASSTGETSQPQFEIDQTSSTGVIAIVKNKESFPTVVVANSVDAAVSVESSDSFCIGGAEIYSLFLLNSTIRPNLRILQTEVRKVDDSAFECDTFWPENLAGSEDGWKEVPKDQISEWTDVPLPQGSDEWHKDEKAQAFIRVRGWSRA